MTSNWVRVLSGAWALLALLPGQDARSFGKAELVFSLRDPSINESSGVARSYSRPGWFYTHNDSGDSARFWRFERGGRLEGPWKIPGAKAVDWEDMASAKVGGKSYLYFADIGDNAEKRKSIQIYRIEEPFDLGTVDKVDTFDLIYPDKAHNAEALLVHPTTGEMLIVTKVVAKPALVFGLDAGTKPGKHMLAKRGQLPGNGFSPQTQMITGGDVAPDGKHLILRTYFGAYEYPVGKTFSRFFESSSISVSLRPETQGEAIGYSLDGKTLITTSEGSPCPVTEIPIKS